MAITEKLMEQFKAIHKVIWIILLPVILDIGELSLFKRIFKSEYEPVSKLFNFKIGFISSPPSIRYFLEDFPSLIFQYNSSAFRGVINQINLTNMLLYYLFFSRHKSFGQWLFSRYRPSRAYKGNIKK